MEYNTIHPVIHYNKIGHEINESVTDYSNSDRTIYCRQHHTILSPGLKRCANCPLFYDSMGAYGVACKWDDVNPRNMIVVPHKNCQKEFLRVSQLMDEGLLKRLG